MSSGLLQTQLLVFGYEITALFRFIDVEISLELFLGTVTDIIGGLSQIVVVLNCLNYVEYIFNVANVIFYLDAIL